MSEEYQEINLIDYLRTIVKHRKMIIATALIIIGLSLIYIFLKPNMYEAESLMKIGQIDNQAIDNKHLIITSIFTQQNLAEILEQVTGDESAVSKSKIQWILKNIQINGTDDEIPFPDDYLHIFYQDTDPQKAVRIIQELQNLIIQQDNKFYDSQLKIYNQNTAQLEKELTKHQEELTEASKTVKDLTELRYPVGYAEAQGRTGSAYINSLNDLRNKISSLEVNILNRKLVAETSTMTTVVSPPLFPDTPVKSSQKSMPLIISLALILGLFIGLLLAYGYEWWLKNKASFKK